MSRPSTSSQPSTGYLAVDIGGTKLAAGVVGPDGSVLIRDRVPTPARAPWPALARLVSRVQAALPNVTLISQGASSINFTFAVEEERMQEAVRRLHAAFFGPQKGTK